MKPRSYKISVEGDWSLEDFYIFSRTFEQIYYFSCSLRNSDDPFKRERIERTYAGFPWQGGYSSVNFFNSLKYIVDNPDRPKIISILYSSPGWIELSLLIAGALSVERLISSVANSVLRMNSVYHEIVKGLQKRELLRLKVRQSELDLNRSELAYIEECAQTMCRLLGFQDINEVNQLTGSHYKTLKILLSVYRRVRILAGFHNKGKIKLPK